MSERDLQRIEVLSKVVAGRMTMVTAAHVLDLSTRRSVVCWSGCAVTSAVTADAVRKAAAQCVAHGMPARVLDAAETRAATGTARYPAALFDPRGGDLHPLNYVRGLVGAAQSAGAKIHGNSCVLSAQRQSGKWLLRTEKATVSAEKLLVVTNAYADGLWPNLRKSPVPVYSSIVATEAPPDYLAARILPQRPVLYESGHITVCSIASMPKTDC